MVKKIRLKFDQPCSSYYYWCVCWVMSERARPDLTQMMWLTHSRHLYLFVELWLWTIPSTGHRITKNNRLTHLGDLPQWVGFRPPSLHVKSCSAVRASGRFLPARPSKRGTWYDVNVAGCLGGWLDVTRRYCIKTAKSVLKRFPPSGSPIILVSSDPCADIQFQGEPLQRGR